MELYPSESKYCLYPLEQLVQEINKAHVNVRFVYLLSVLLLLYKNM